MSTLISDTGLRELLWFTASLSFFAGLPLLVARGAQTLYFRAEFTKDRRAKEEVIRTMKGVRAPRRVLAAILSCRVCGLPWLVWMIGLGLFAFTPLNSKAFVSWLLSGLIAGNLLVEKDLEPNLEIDVVLHKHGASDIT